jgi:sulfite reductase (ferredoxin)
MGRKIKFSFSSDESDSAFSYIHDLGFIPKINDKGERGFKVMLGGGLGAQPFLANLVHEFLHEDQIIPYAEAMLRVFDRYGERTNRNKARLKYLIQKLGLDEVLRLIEEERIANKVKSFKIDRDAVSQPSVPEAIEYPVLDDVAGSLDYKVWRATNVVPQKQEGFFAVYIKVTKGDIPTEEARKLVAAISPYVADEIRITQNQGLMLKFAREAGLPGLYVALKELGFAKAGFDSVADVTTCPGTDTCNLGISNSMSLSVALEDVIYDEYPELVHEKQLNIKISGCMNSCGQHGLAEIGFHGSSVKANGKVVPAVQVMLGGGTVGDGEGRVAERVIKAPSKRATDVLRVLLNDFAANVADGENFHAYYDRQTKDYFYQLLKPLADLTNLKDEEFVDWGHEETFVTAIGVGECAGVVIDLVATLLLESEEKLSWAKASYEAGAWSDAIYHTYAVYVSAAKALLLDKGVNSSTQIGIIREFDNHYVQTGEIQLESSFADLVLEINKHEPSEEFATAYLASLEEFYNGIKAARAEKVS